MIDDNEHLVDQIAELVIQIYQMHDVIIAQTGGLAGLRDGAMLHAAVARPFATFAGEVILTNDLKTGVRPTIAPTTHSVPAPK